MSNKKPEARVELEIQLGDVVRLKTGGPMMTIEKIIEDTRTVECVWFTCEVDAELVPTGEWHGPHRGTFSIAVLTRP